MPELCRNFQRGSCRYGERCKFLHSVQQQTKPTSPFGFGSGQQQQQQSSNPYGFGAKQQQNKPFGNTWNRFNPSDNEAGHAPSSTKQKPDSKTQAANHTCTDPETCKRLIAEDFEQERPIWKLTCYGHARNGPCDIVGDISYEELRAVAYDDAKRGINVQSIVERERNLSNSKLVEFQNLLQTPYVARLGSAVGMQNLFPRATTNGMSPTGLSSAPPQVSSFSQLGASLNTGFGARYKYVLSLIFELFS
ncbi:Zinc finger CCCH domain-containing protein 16 [Linum perenne]